MLRLPPEFGEALEAAFGSEQNLSPATLWSSLLKLPTVDLIEQSLLSW